MYTSAPFACQVRAAFQYFPGAAALSETSLVKHALKLKSIATASVTYAVLVDGTVIYAFAVELATVDAGGRLALVFRDGCVKARNREVCHGWQHTGSHEDITRIPGYLRWHLYVEFSAV